MFFAIGILDIWICFSCDYYFSWRNLIRFKGMEETFLSFFLFLEFIKCSSRLVFWIYGYVSRAIIIFLGGI